MFLAHLAAAPVLRAWMQWRDSGLALIALPAWRKRLQQTGAAAVPQQPTPALAERSTAGRRGLPGGAARWAG